MIQYFIFLFAIFGFIGFRDLCEAKAILKVTPTTIANEQNNEKNVLINLRKLKALSQRYNPEVRRLLSHLVQSLTKNGRGLALAVVGVQHLASEGIRRIQALKFPNSGRDIENVFSISTEDANSALTQGLAIFGSNGDELKKDGWKPVHESDMFSLFKRRIPGRKGKGPVEYLTFGFLGQVSPRTFLRAQVEKVHREKWDQTVASMESVQNGPNDIIEGSDGSYDIQYYRAKWPWPLKDRDYTLSRRCLRSKDKRAMVFVSKSISFPDKPPVEKVIRVDKYRCFSVFLSAPKTGKPDLDAAGVSYVSVFCDDTKVALPSAVVDLVAKHAEKVVPNSMNKLFAYCLKVQK